MRRIAFANQKGGVGKTTCCVNLAAALAAVGKHILLIDSDPQANASIHLGVDVNTLKNSLYDVLVAGIPIEKVLIKNIRENLDCIPSSIDLSGAEVELANTVGRELILRNAIDTFASKNSYDFLLIDCPPSLGLISINSFCAVDEIFLAVQTEFFALQGISKLMEIVSLVKRRLNPALRISGVIATMVDTRTNLSREVLQDLNNFFNERLFKTTIRNNVRLAEAPGFGKTIFEYDPLSHGAQDFKSLAEEILSKNNP
ncbi:MAG: AAA family ATPase [Planctomycetota bacterium]|nr:AAA family ATPase [Planctomycetota bacterium]